MKKLLLLLCALTMSVGTIWADKTVYLNPYNGVEDAEHYWTATNNWTINEGVNFIVYVYESSNGSNNGFYDPVGKISVDGLVYYKFVVADNFDKIIILRKSDTNHDWNNINNRKDPSETFADNDLYSITGWTDGNNDFSKTSNFNPYSGSTKKMTYLETSFWDAGSGDEAYSAYVSDDSGMYDWISPSSQTSNSGKTYHVFEIPDNYSGIIFVRGDLANAPIAGWGEKNNQTQIIIFSETALNTLFTIDSWDDGGKDGAGKATSGYSPSMMNLALLGTASASYSEGGNTADKANDGDAGTRWGTYGNPGDKNADWFQIAWDTPQTFNTIRIYCEGAMNRDVLEFKIQTSDNGEDWTDRSTVSGKQAANGEYLTIQFEQVTSKYIRFQGVTAGFSDCYSFYEFEVYNYSTTLTLTTLEISAAKTSLMSSKTTTFTAKGKDQLNGVMNPGTLAWISSNETVGTISDGTFTAKSEGTTNITATANSGAITSNSVTITVTALLEPTDVPTPSIDASNVKAMYSHNYTEIGANIEGDWTRTNVTFNEKKALKVNDFSWIQFTLGADHKAQGMERIHLDFFPTENMPTIVIRAKGDGFSKQVMKNLSNGTWDNDVDFSLTDDLGLTEEQIYNITLIQIVKNDIGSGNGNGTEEFYIGNLYFYKESISPSSITSVTVTAAASSIAEGNTTQLTVKDQADNTVTGLMTFNSNNTSVATVDANGLVTAVSEGTARITATVTGSDPAVSNYVDITVTEAQIGFDVTSTDGNHKIHVYPYHIVDAVTDNYKLVITSNEEMENLTDGCYWRTSEKSDEQMKPKSNVSTDKHRITVVTTSSFNPVIYNPLYIMMPGEVMFTTGIQNVDLDWIDVVEIPVSSYEWASFSSTHALDFGKVDGLTAYIATEASSNVTYEEVTKVPAATGLILNGAEETYDVPVVASAPALGSTNLLKPAADANVVISAEDAATGKYYAFGRIGSDVGFVKMAATGYTVSQGKAYMQLSEALAAKGLEFIGLPGTEDPNETNGINAIEKSLQNGEAYNLAGQRVDAGYKGIVIINGKKYVRK